MSVHGVACCILKDPLLEEYSIAAQVYNLSAIDLCEIARNSVLQSGWDEQSKRQWIGKRYRSDSGVAANDIVRTNVPNARCQFRHLLLSEECRFVESLGNPRYLDEDTVSGMVSRNGDGDNGGGLSSGIQSKIDGLIAMIGSDQSDGGQQGDALSGWLVI